MKTFERTVLWLALGGWFGSWALFALAVAPAAFRVLAPTEGGALVGPILRSLHLYGVLAGLVLGALAFRAGRRGVLLWLPLLLAAICGVSEFGVSGAIAHVRPRDFGPETAPEAAARFAMLHQLSRVLYGAVLLSVVGLIGLHAREEARGSATTGVETP